MVRRTNGMSFSDCVDEDGALLRPIELAELLGSEAAVEVVEQMYGMIWFLAGGVPDRVDLAERNFEMGILMSQAKVQQW